MSGFRLFLSAVVFCAAASAAIAQTPQQQAPGVDRYLQQTAPQQQDSQYSATPQAPADPAAPAAAAAAEAPPEKPDPCAAYAANYDYYTICQDRIQKIQRMQDAKTKRSPQPAVTTAAPAATTAPAAGTAPAATTTTPAAATTTTPAAAEPAQAERPRVIKKDGILIKR